ncbi:MAG: hypothetical protein HGA49_05270 [Eubacteriaceae bacterium]|nr:hypothetical protein [Eubacteriaceae bacterium]
MAKKKKRNSPSAGRNSGRNGCSQNVYNENFKKENYSKAKGLLFRNKYFWLSALCGLYFLKEFNPAFAWFGALGALGFYKNENPWFRKLIFLSLLSVLGLVGFFV